MRLSELNRMCHARGIEDAVIAIENSAGVPVDPAGIDFGVVVLAEHGPYPYLMLTPPAED